MTAVTHIVRLENAAKTYRMGTQDVRALGGVSVAFDRGSFWAVMGPSGSGKSTMMNILGCLDRLTSGSYYLEGMEVGSMTDNQRSELRLRRIGFVFQSFHLIPRLTVQRNIELPLDYLGWASDRSADRARALAEAVGLGDRLGHLPGELSGGEMQRAAIARALANDPHLILADEPTGNLDTATGRQILDLLGGLHAEGKTLVVVTHEPAVAARAENRLYMVDGVVDTEKSDLPSCATISSATSRSASKTCSSAS